MAPKVYTVRQAFNSGEVSGLVAFRDDVAKYASACLTLENAVPLVEGGAKKMPGSYFAGTTALGGAMFTASISGTVMTVTSVNFGVIQVGQLVVGAGLVGGPTIASQGTGTGGVGTYNLSLGQGIIASEMMQTSASGKSRLVPFQFSTVQGAVLELSAGQIRIWEGAQQGSWSLGLALNVPFSPGGGGGGQSWTLAGASAGATTNGGTNSNTSGSSGLPVVAISQNLVCTVPISIAVNISSVLRGGGSGVAQFQYSPNGGTGWTTFYNRGFNTTQSVSQNLSFSITGVTSLDQLQFRVIASAYSSGMTPPTVNVNASYGTCSISLPGSAQGNNYNPATLYAPGNIALVGPYSVLYKYGVSSFGYLFIAALFGTSNAGTVPVTVTTNSVDSLVVTKTGSSPNQGINIALANATRANNAANLIQNAIQALGSLNSSANNFVDLTQWTVTPDPIYFGSPWITAPGYPPQATYFTWQQGNQAVQCFTGNQNDQFPITQQLGFNSPYWGPYTQLNQPIVLNTPYQEGDLFALDCSTQSADVLWIFHTSYPPAVVERLGPNSWKYSVTLPGNEPGEPAYRGTTDVVKTGYSAIGQSITAITQASPCVVTVSASTAVFASGQRIYMNEIAGMVELNQGEFLVANPSLGSGTFSFSLLDPDTNSPINSTGYLAYVSGGFVVPVVALFTNPGDYPACGTLYQERLTLGGTLNNPNKMYGSVQDDYPDFICDPNADDFAIQFTLVSNKLDQLINMIGTPNALAIGTAGGVWIMSGSNGLSLSQTNVTASKQTTMGVGNIQPQLVGSSAIFVSRSARIVLFMVFNFVSNQWDNYDLTRLNRNITLGPTQATSGIVQTAFQVEPYPILWAVRADGQLIGLVFNTQDQVYAWFRVNMLPGVGIIESVAVISGQNIEDQVVVVVNRGVNGVNQRYVEYFMPQELFGLLSNAYFVNGGQQLQLLGPVNITGISNANPAQVTAPNHGFSNGMLVQIQNVLGMTQINQDATQAYTIQVVDQNNFQLLGMDSTAFGVYTGGGTVKQVTNTVTGLSYLLGLTVTAVGDGAVILQPTVVTSDSIVFPYYANLITIGIPYQMTVQPTNPTLSSQAATTRGMKQKLDRVSMSLYQAMGGFYGQDLNHMYPMSYGLNPTAPPQMSTTLVTADMDCDWSDESTFYITQSDPLPFTVRGLIARMSVNQD